MSPPKTKEKVTKWFDPWLSDQLFLPCNPSFADTTINKHVTIQSFDHQNQSTLDLWFADCNPPNKRVKRPKNYTKAIQTLQTKLNQTSDLAQIKKIQIALKSSQTKLHKQQVNANKILKCFTIGVPLDTSQHLIVSGWYQECIRVYNQCVELETDSNKSLVFEELRERVFISLYKDQDKPAPYETLGDEVRSFLSNRKSCLTSMRRKVITHFTQRPRSLKANQSLMIPGKAIVKSGIFSRALGSIRDWSSIYKQIQQVCGEDRLCDSRLIYDSVLKRYTLNIPYYASKPNVTVKRPVVAVDPGERIFMTYYSPEESGYIGNNIRLPILAEERKIRRLERVLKQGVNKEKQKLNNPKTIRRRIQLKYNRIRNLVTELHHQTAKYLTDRYDHIYIPKFETQKMLCRRKPKATISLADVDAYKRRGLLNKRVKFVMNSLAHYRFRQHLQNKCLEKGCKMQVVNESYTSATCGGCGRQSKKYENRVKQCKCGCQIDRDLNGSRNILMRTLKLN
jgi:putative transposase